MWWLLQERQNEFHQLLRSWPLFLGFARNYIQRSFAKRENNHRKYYASLLDQINMEVNLGEEKNSFALWQCTSTLVHNCNCNISPIMLWTFPSSTAFSRSGPQVTSWWKKISIQWGNHCWDNYLSCRYLRNHVLEGLLIWKSIDKI